MTVDAAMKTEAKEKIMGYHQNANRFVFCGEIRRRRTAWKDASQQCETLQSGSAPVRTRLTWNIWSSGLIPVSTWMAQRAPVLGFKLRRVLVPPESSPSSLQPQSSPGSLCTLTRPLALPS